MLCLDGSLPGQVVEGQAASLTLLLDSSVALLEGREVQEESHLTTSVFLSSVHPTVTK